MADRQAAPPRNSSRTLAIAAVVVLIVIAVAGIVLAGMRGRHAAGEAPVAVDATRGEVPAPTSPVSAAAAVDEAAPNIVVFAPSSSQLPGSAQAKLVKLADEAKKGRRTVAITAKIEARGDHAEQRKLAQDRAIAMRQVMEANGVPLGTMQIEIMEAPKGFVAPREVNRLEVTLR